MKLLRLLTIMLTALSMSAAFAHLLEMPAKIHYDGPKWLNLLQTLYPTFGKVSGVCEIGAVVASFILVVAVRKQPNAFRWTLLGTSCLAATHAIFWIWVAPVNATMVPLTPETLPVDWTRLRDQWEFSHAIRALLQIAALDSFVLSILSELPKTASRPSQEELDERNAELRWWAF
jgi:Domain of unknown function (DUF1772)